MDYLSLQADLGDAILSESSAAKTINRASSGGKNKNLHLALKSSLFLTSDLKAVLPHVLIWTKGAES